MTPLDPPVLINSRLQQIEGKKLLGCLTCSAATDVGMLGNSKMPLNCLCTLLTMQCCCCYSSFLFVCFVGLYAGHPYIQLISLEIFLLSLNSQWKMHHCDVPSSFFLVFFASAEHLYCFCALNSTSPPTHFTRAPPSHAKNRYLNSRLMILHASELETELVILK